MIDYDNVTLSIYDYAGNKLGLIYSAQSRMQGQAYDIKLTHENTGFKSLSFSIPKIVNGDPNPLIEYQQNEYIVEIDGGEHSDRFYISEPSISHNSAEQTLTVSCNHVSSRQRMKKLYLVLDDTNGVGTINDLMILVLQGTGWTLGQVGMFYESDGVTEKVRSAKSSGKDGAYQQVTKICELFNARPVFNGMDNTVNIFPFRPYAFEEEGALPTLLDPKSVVELNYSKGMSGVTRKLNTENMITRLYVEGSFGEDGYVGIEEVNPTGLNFLMDFEYFKNIGLLTPEHENIIDTYQSEQKTFRDKTSSTMERINIISTRLMENWGDPDYSIYEVTNNVTESKFAVNFLTASEDGPEPDVAEDNHVAVLQDNATHHYSLLSSYTGGEIIIKDPISSERTATHIVVYRVQPSGLLGGRESAAEAAEEKREELRLRIGDNLVYNSDTSVSGTSHLLHTYTLSTPWITGKTYTLSIYGTISAESAFRAARDSGSVDQSTLSYDADKRCWQASFECPAGAANDTTLSIYSHPAGTGAHATIMRLKLEFGDTPTPWTAAQDSANQDIQEEYAERIRNLYYGTEDSLGIYALLRSAVSDAIELQGERNEYKSNVATVSGLEDSFSEELGNLLRDGYWQDDNYVVGQEVSLFKDAMDVMRIMSRPVASYEIIMNNVVGVDAAPHMNISINNAVHIIDEDIAVNEWGYISQVAYVLDTPYLNSIKVDTQESKYAGKTFTQILSAIADTAREVRAKQGMFSRAAVIGADGRIGADLLNGEINVEMTRLLSTTSNWHTDEMGNLIFISQDGTSAMKLTGEGFMIANGRRSDGAWSWRTLGTGRGLIADEVTSGTLRANIIKILGTDQFYWDADNIYITNPDNLNEQIRIGRYDGQHYGIGFTKDDGANWEAAFGFDGVNLSYKSIDVSQVLGMSDYATKNYVENNFATEARVGGLDAALEDLNKDVRQNISFTAGGIIIVQEGAEEGFNSRFTGTGLDFYEGSDRIAWFENRALHVDNVVTNKLFSIGKQKWYVGGDHSIAVKWED